MATIRKRTWQDGTESFQVQIRRKGASTESATFDRLADAKKWARHTETAIEQGKHFKTSAARRRTFAELVDRYLESGLTVGSEVERRKRAKQLEWWRDKLGPLTLADLTPDRIADCRDELLEDAATGLSTDQARHTREAGPEHASARHDQSPPRCPLALPDLRVERARPDRRQPHGQGPPPH